MPYAYTSDAYSPLQIALEVESVGVLKTEAHFIQTFVLEAFARAVIGNLFVCVAVWISIGGRSVADKFLGALVYHIIYRRYT